MEFVESTDVAKRLEAYPKEAQLKLQQVRELILSTAKNIEGINKIVETTKWGEPSYVTKTGSTIRMDWKPKTPEKYYVYFICSTELVSTFRTVIGDELEFEGNRAIVLNLDEKMPSAALTQCFKMALNYHKVKHLPLLGA